MIKIPPLPSKGPSFNRGDRHGGRDLWPSKSGYKVLVVCAGSRIVLRRQASLGDVAANAVTKCLTMTSGFASKSVIS